MTQLQHSEGRLARPCTDPSRSLGPASALGLMSVDIPQPAPDVVPLPPSPHPTPAPQPTPPEVQEPPMPGRAPVVDPLVPNSGPPQPLH